MYKSYPKQVDITSDLAGGDLNISDKREEAGSGGKYNLIPTAVIICKSAAGNPGSEALDCELRGGGRATLYLQCNEIHELAVEKIYKAGSSTETIVVLGENN